MIPLPRPTPRSAFRSARGLSLIELLIALAILGIALVAFAFSQVGALQASTRSALVTEAKAAANRVLEAKTTDVLQVSTVATSSQYCDQAGASDCRSFAFTDYYYGCETATNPPWGTRGGTSANLRDVDCGDTIAASVDGNGSALDGVESIDVVWEVLGRSGVAGEGIVDIVVTARAQTGAIVTVGTTIVCYDVFPAPTKDAPEPCPDTPPNGSAGGRL